MFQLLIGGVVGFFVGFIFFISILLTTNKFDVAIATNIVIAFATMVATTIHWNSIIQKRKDRIWDMNKPVLLDLSHSLSQVIKATQFYLQQEYADRCMYDPPTIADKPTSNVYKDFKQKEEYALNVYKTLMSKDLIKALAEAKRINQNIDIGVKEYGVDHIAAYEESIDAYQNLKRKLDFFIAKISGVKDL